MMTYDDILKQFEAWANDNPDIRGALIIGSQARTERPADRWSDLDLLVFATNPEPYVQTTDWLDHIGPYVLTFCEETAGGAIERRVLFDGMLDVDLPFLPTNALDAPEFIHFSADIVRRGVRIVLDKDGRLAPLLDQVTVSEAGTPAPPPDEDTFLNVVNDFWYHAVWTAKKLRRGELWTAFSCVDNYLKNQCLLPMITWHARATQGDQLDTWIKGRFLEKWADPRVVEGLKTAFAHYNAEDLWQALFGTMRLFAWLAPETSAHLGYAYPEKAASTVIEWVDNCYQDWQAESVPE